MSKSRAIVQESVRRFITDEAREIESGFAGTPSKITAADIYAHEHHGISATTAAAAYAERMDAGMVVVLEQRWDAAEKLAELWGVGL